MVGYGFVAGGTSVAGGTGTALTTFTDPTCPGGALTGGTGAGCAATSWKAAGDTTGLCMTGSIPALTACPTNCGAAETGFDYSEDWGAEIGVNAGAAGATLGGTFNSIAVTFTGTTTGTVKLQVLVGTTAYCTVAAYTSGTAVTAASLVTNCYTGGAQSPLASLAMVSQVQLQITSASTAETFSNFCMTGITFQ